MSEKIRQYFRKLYGKRFQAYPADQVEMVEYFFWINEKHGVRLN